MQVTKQHILEDLWMPRTRWRSIARVWAEFGAPYASRAKTFARRVRLCVRLRVDARAREYQIIPEFGKA
jgi:hypothetical protein